MFSIGEFSKISGLTIKALRFYHDKQLLVPSYVDAGSGYRYYDTRSLEKARVIVALRELGFALSDITDVLAEHDDESEILEHLERQQQRMQRRLEQDAEIARQLRTIISKEKEARALMQQSSYRIEEKNLDNILIAGIRMQGRYSDCGKCFSKLGRSFGRHICGKPFLLLYDNEYKEEDADFEACMPIRRGTDVAGVSVRELAGGRCMSLLHQGPYDQMGRSYAELLDHLKQHELTARVPCREVYIKGPGMIFRGNPKKYLTEIQLLVEP